MDEKRFRELLAQSESEILEFKVSNSDPDRIGKYISALANSATMLSRQFAYIIWGVSDDKEIIGTNFYPETAKKGGEPLISWLERMLDPRVSIEFKDLIIDEQHIVALSIHMTAGRPVSFNGYRYIRSGSSLKNLSDYPEKERELWRAFDSRSFEREFALLDCTKEEIFNILDVKKYLDMIEDSSLSSPEKVLINMEKDFIIEKVNNNYNITNLGAYTFAKDLREFAQLRSHAVRVIRYKGVNKLSALSDTIASKGVVVGFEGLLSHVRQHLPVQEEIYEESGRKVQKSDYPPLAIRELVANQIVHQDFSVRGSNPMIEIYDNRVEITNPGAPINDANRLLDLPPISRNEELANLFKKIHLVESRGSGIDKVVITLEAEILPAPTIEAKENNTIVTLYQQMPLSDMNDRERINAIYYHASRLYLENSFMTNKSVRERFGLTQKQSAMASKVISLAVKNNLVKPYDESVGNKFKQYIPFWADSQD